MGRENKERIQALATPNRKVFAFFDFDDTLSYGDSILYWLSYYYQQRPQRRYWQVITWGSLVLTGLKFIHPDTFKRIMLSPLAWENPRNLKIMAKNFAEQELPKHLFQRMISRVWAHYRLGHEVIILSASSNFYLKHISSLLPPCTIIGTEVQFKKKGWFRFARLKGGNTKGIQKLAAIARYKDLPQTGEMCFAYSDHVSDHFLLEFAEFPNCVQPEPKLKKMAEEIRWPLIEIKRSKSDLYGKLEKLIMMLLGIGPFPPYQKILDQRAIKAEGVDEETMIQREIEEIKARVALKYPEKEYPEIHKHIFASSMSSMT